MKPASRTIDATGLLCPMPVLRAQKALREMVAGEVLELHTTDPASWNDVPAFCTEAGHQMLSRDKSDERMTFIIERL